jgi:uncharacterized protein (DUF1330 family)
MSWDGLGLMLFPAQYYSEGSDSALAQIRGPATEQSMPAYLLTLITITDPEIFSEYRKLALSAVAQYGGKFLVRDGARTVLEGKFDANRLVLIEFASTERAKVFYDSPEYQAAREKRIGGADFNMIVVEGTDA